MLRFARSILALFVGVLGFAADSSAIERTVYAIDAYGNLVSGVLPTSSWPMQLTTIADYDSFLAGSAIDSDGSLLTMFVETDELVKIDLVTLEYQVLHTLAVDIWEFDDLVFGPAGELLLVLHGDFFGLSSLFEIDTTIGELTLLADFDQEFKTIEYHRGAYYAGTWSEFWRIDSETFETHLVKDYSFWTWGSTIWGLASMGNTLWCGYSHTYVGQGGSNHDSYIGTIEPVTGDFSEHAKLDGYYGGGGDPHMLQLVERIVPIPALRPTGVAILVMLLGLIGTLAIRRF